MRCKLNLYKTPIEIRIFIQVLSPVVYDSDEKNLPTCRNVPLCRYLQDCDEHNLDKDTNTMTVLQANV